ncbi:putative disease resistance protein RGA1 [Pistacia vera]|uniref:putative disease resistance protein RGA1 n=1 Tax=Pistacia vera TaxID=55513 RepID=UPI0012633C04|nr:putative disease resistance protein RGA1 [Pistacia vera]
MVDATVSAVLEQLSSSSLTKKIEGAGVNTEVLHLKNNLRDMKEAVIDAEQRQVKEEHVRFWLDKLKYALYDMEDEFDEVLRMPNDKVGSLIKELNSKLRSIATEKNMIGFTVNRSVEKPEPFQCISLVDESEMIGQVELKQKLIGMLCESRSDKQKGPHIISLVGVRGTGKTSLAKVVYENDKIASTFEKKIWVSASNPFDELKIAKAIVAALEGAMPAFVDLGSLLQHLCKLIIGRRILLVLDDVQIEDYNRWKPLHYCLENCHSESKILITTQEESISRIMKAADLLTVKELSEEECQSLFRRFAFFNKLPKQCEELEPFVKQVVDKCKGLPLAIKVMGSFLCSKRSTLEWQSILNSEMWKVDEEFENGIPFFLLSYINLPSIVKRCLSYCAIFPQNYLINKDQLIKLWMAQGYLGSENNKEMELMGQEFFDYLVTRSFFQEFDIDDDGGIISCKMHGIAYNFLKFITKHECLAMEVNGDEQSSPNPDYDQDEVRQSMLMLSKEASFPNSILRFKKLRSLLVQSGVTNSSSVPQEVFDQLLLLRALDISGKLLYQSYPRIYVSCIIYRPWRSVNASISTNYLRGWKS